MPKFYNRSETKISSSAYDRFPKMLTEEKLLPEHATKPINHLSDEEHTFEKGPNPIRTLLSWKAPARPYRKKDRSYYTTVGILLILVCLIAFFIGERLLIGAVLAVGFVVYVLNFVPPEEIENKISTQGLTMGDHFYHWNELDSFWIEEKDGHKVLSVLTLLNFPGLLMLLLDNVNEEDVKTVCARYLPFHEIVPKSMARKWADSLQKHFPLENPHR